MEELDRKQKEQELKQKEEEENKQQPKAQDSNELDLDAMNFDGIDFGEGFDKEAMNNFENLNLDDYIDNSSPDTLKGMS